MPCFQCHPRITLCDSVNLGCKGLAVAFWILTFIPSSFSHNLYSLTMQRKSCHCPVIVRMYMRTSFAAARTLGRDSFIMNMDDYSIVCFHDIIIYYMFPANNFGDSFAGNLRFAIFAINFFEHFKYLYFSTLSYKKVFKKARVIH